MSPYRVIFVHGYTATPDCDWYPSLRPMLDNAHIDYVIPQLPGDEHPHAVDWIRSIHVEIQKTKKPIVLVGHSLGTRAILLYLERG